MSKKVFHVFIYTVLVLISIIIILPILWLIISAVQPGSTLFSSTFVPKGFTTEHFISIFTKTDFPLWYMNTLKIAVFNTVFSVMLTTLSAYAFSRYNFSHKKDILLSILLLQMFPSFLAMTAIYILLAKMGLLNTHIGLLLVYVAAQLPYNTWLMKGYFDNVPRDLDEAAKIDGADHLTIFIKIILPVVRPIIVVVAITNFIAPWFDYIFPTLILRSAEKKTLAMGIFEWISGFANDNFTEFACASILVAFPIVILFIVLQKHIVEGLTQGSVK